MAIDTRVNGYSHTPYKVRRIDSVRSRMVASNIYSVIHLMDYSYPLIERSLNLINLDFSEVRIKVRLGSALTYIPLEASYGYPQVFLHFCASLHISAILGCFSVRRL